MQAKFAQAIAAMFIDRRGERQRGQEAQVKNLGKLYAMIGRKKWQSSYFWLAIGI